MVEFGYLEGDCATDFYCAGGAAEAVPAGFHRYILLNPHGRGEANRTPASGFGDRGSATKLLPFMMVGQGGIEPPSSGFSDRRSDLVSYCPIWYSQWGSNPRHRLERAGT